jgi:hypothetical protein
MSRGNVRGRAQTPAGDHARSRTITSTTSTVSALTLSTPMTTVSRMWERRPSRVFWGALLVGFCSFVAACKAKEAGIEPTPPAAVHPAASAGVSAASLPAPAASPSELVAVARELEKTCAAICERSRTLKCKSREGCVPNCLAMAAGTPCSAQFALFYGCLVKEPVEHWECDPEGVAAIREGFCDKEQERALACMEAKARP